MRENQTVHLIEIPLVGKTASHGTACMENAKTSAKLWLQDRQNVAASYCKHVCARLTMLSTG